MGILDQDVDDKVSLAVPQLYRRGIERKEWTQIKFWYVARFWSAQYLLTGHRTYMFDGIYQSLICFFMAYLLFAPATFVTESGMDVNDHERMGVFVACATVAVVNLYVLINTYRWDWLMLLLVAISILLIWFWTGVYTSFTSSSIVWYKAASEVYGTLAFWALSLLIVIICLMPRFAAKAVQKIYLPRDVDIIREQIRQGKFKYLDAPDAKVALSEGSSSSSDISKTSKPTKPRVPMPDDDERPIYPPSVAPTSTHNPRSQTGSDGTDYTGHRMSLDPPTRPSFDRPRPSFDRIRNSMDQVRASYEHSNDFTSAALLSRVESSHSGGPFHLPRLGSSSLR